MKLVVVVMNVRSGDRGDGHHRHRGDGGRAAMVVRSGDRGGGHRRHYRGGDCDGGSGGRGRNGYKEW